MQNGNISILREIWMTGCLQDLELDDHFIPQCRLHGSEQCIFTSVEAGATLFRAEA